MFVKADEGRHITPTETQLTLQATEKPFVYRICEFSAPFKDTGLVLSPTMTGAGALKWRVDGRVHVGRGNASSAGENGFETIGEALRAARKALTSVG